MKKTFQVTLCTISISLLCIVSGCSKGGDSTTTPPTTITKKQLLTSSAWGIAGVQHKAVTSSVWTDDYASMKPCEKDNKVVFTIAGSYETNEGATKCSPNDPQILQTGTWSFTQNETMLVVQATNGTTITNATIETLTATSLVMSYTDVVGGVTYQYKQTLSH